MKSKWEKRMEIQYIEATKADMEPVIALYEQYLDSGEHLRAILTACFEDTSFIGYKAVCDGKLAGFYFGCGLLEFSVPHPKLEQELKELMKDEDCFVVGGLLVLPKFRGQGIARQMILMVRERLLQAGIRYFVVEIAMDPDGAIPSKALYELTGEVIFSRSIPGFYRDGYLYGVVCAICGTHCRCSACIEVMEVV